MLITRSFSTKTPEGCHIVTEEVQKGPGGPSVPRAATERHARGSSALADDLEGPVGEALNTPQQIISR